MTQELRQWVWKPGPRGARLERPARHKDCRLLHDVIYTVSMANSSGLHGDGKAIRTYTDGKGHRRICQGVKAEHESCLTTKDCSATMELPPSHRGEPSSFPSRQPHGGRPSCSLAGACRSGNWPRSASGRRCACWPASIERTVCAREADQRPWIGGPPAPDHYQRHGQPGWTASARRWPPRVISFRPCSAKWSTWASSRATSAKCSNDWPITTRTSSRCGATSWRPSPGR